MFVTTWHPKACMEMIDLMNKSELITMESRAQHHQFHQKVSLEIHIQRISADQAAIHPHSKGKNGAVDAKLEDGGFVYSFQSWHMPSNMPMNHLLQESYQSLFICVYIYTSFAVIRDTNTLFFHLNM
jgi:hypothetical protein